MTNVNFNAQAQEIYKLLDDAETTKGVDNGSNRLGKSIWNSFVGEGQSEDVQIGTEKSKINNSISMENAVNSIVAYLRKNGTEKVQKALQNVGINWSPKDVYAEEVKSDTGETNLAKSSKSSKAEQRVIDKHNKLKTERDKITNLATTEKASNGMTYSEAKDVIAEIRRIFKLS